MNVKVIKLLETLQVIEFVRYLRGEYRKFVLPNDYAGQEVSDKIFGYLNSDKPVMICRLGSIELAAVKRISLIMKGKLKYSQSDFATLQSNAGFFPLDYENLKNFHYRVLADFKQIDLLGQFCTIELFFKKHLKHSVKVALPDLEPYYHKIPWSRILEGKKVLVVYPFDVTIRAQYKNREKLFVDPRVLPKFKLITLRAVQSLGGNSDEFDNWFDALKYMEDKISAIDFDIAIIGCGAYGLPLAAHVKRIGKKAVHLGSATQILFGIKGKRWEESNFEFINNYWVRPLDSERPANYKQVENGCYW